MNPTKAYQIRVVRVCETPSIKLDAPELARTYWQDVIAKQPWYDPEKEQIVVITLNTRYSVLGFSLVSMGTMNESLCHPRDVFRPAIAQGAYAVVLMHNHPSGDHSPSQCDHSLTRRMDEASKILTIKLLDHVIVGSSASGSAPSDGVLSWNSGKYFSFKEAGVL